MRDSSKTLSHFLRAWVIRGSPSMASGPTARPAESEHQKRKSTTAFLNSNKVYEKQLNKFGSS